MSVHSPKLNAERALLGACLLNPTVVDFVMQRCCHNFFEDRQHALLYSRVLALHRSGSPISIEGLLCESDSAEFASWVRGLVAEPSGTSPKALEPVLALLGLHPTRLRFDGRFLFVVPPPSSSRRADFGAVVVDLTVVAALEVSFDKVLFLSHEGHVIARIPSPDGGLETVVAFWQEARR